MLGNSNLTSDSYSFYRKFGIWNSESVCHALFDGNIQNHLGSNSKTSLTFFKNLLIEKYKQTPITDIVFNSVAKIQLVKPFLELTIDVGKVFSSKAETITDKFQNYFTTTKGGKISSVTRTLKTVTYRQIKEFEKKPEIGSLIEYLRNKLAPLIAGVEYDELITSSGWAGHLVGFHYKKLEENKYEYTLFNSGQGIDRHESRIIDDVEEFSVCRSFVGSEEDFFKMYTHVWLFDCVLILGDSAHELYYDTLPTSATQEEVYTHIENMRWIQPQLSGTCTYFGFFYAIKYLFYSKNLIEEFPSFEKYIVDTSVNALLHHIREQKKILPDSKLFLDLLYQKYKDSAPKTTFTDLYQRYIQDVKDYTVTNNVFDPTKHQIFTFTSSKSDILKFFLVYDSSEKLVKNFIILEEMLSKFRSNLTSLGEYIFTTFVYRFLSTAIMLENEHYKNMSLEDQNQLPLVLTRLRENMKAHSFLKQNHSIFIIFLFRIILIRVNENNDYCYFNPSKKDYVFLTTFKYFSTLSTEISIRERYANIVQISDIFKYVVDYYDLILSQECFESVQFMTTTNINVNILEYQNNFSDTFKQNHGLNSDDTLKSWLDSFKMDNSVPLAILSIMSPLKILDNLWSGDDPIKKLNRNADIEMNHDKIQFINCHLHINTKKTYKTHKTIYDPILEISLLLQSDNIHKINDIYGVGTILPNEDEFINIHKNFYEIDFNLEHVKSPLELRAVVLDREDFVSVSGEKYVTDYVERYSKIQELTRILISTETLDKIFTNLNDLAILNILNIILYYHRKTLTDPNIISLLIDNCQKRISRKNNYSSIYKIVVSVLLDTPEVNYELDIYDVDDTSHPLHMRYPDLNHFLHKEHSVKRDDGFDNVDLNKNVLFFEFYNIFLSKLDDNDIRSYISRIQDLLIKNAPRSNKNQIKKFSQFYPKHRNASVQIENSIVTVKSIDEQNKESIVKMFLPDTDIPDKHIGDFFDIFLFEVKSDGIYGRPLDKNIGGIKLTRISENSYSFTRILRTKHNNEISDIEAVFLKDPVREMGDVSILKRGWIARCYEWYGTTTFFYQNQTNKDIFAEFTSFLSTNGKPLLLRISSDGKTYYIDDDLNEYEIVTQSNHFMINRWIYGIPFTCIYRQGKSYKMIFLDTPYSQNRLIHPRESSSLFWIETERFEISLRQRGELTKKMSRYHVAEIEYHGLGCIFPDITSLRSYLLACIAFHNVDCLYTMFPQYLSLLEKPRDDIIVKFIESEDVNNPYTYYFMNCVDKKLERNQNIKYLNRVKKNVYTKRYRSFKSVRTKSHPITVLDPLTEGWFEEVKLGKNYEHQLKTMYLTVIDGRISTLNNLDIQEQKTKNKSIAEMRHVDEANSLENIRQSLISFNDAYHTCQINSSQSKYEEALEKIRILSDRTIEGLSTIDFVTRLSLDPLDENIINHAPTFYLLLQCKTFYSVAEDLIKIVKNPKKEKVCMEMKTIYDKINKDIIYTGKRSINMIIFEILFGWYIKTEQYNIYKEIIDSIDKPGKSSYHVHQLLMGKGKTSVILPLIIFHNIYSNETKQIRNILAVLPKHLTKQTYDSLHDKFYPILGRIDVIPMTISRLGDSNMSLEKINFYVDSFLYATKTKKIIILTDTSYKSLKLNSTKSIIGSYVDEYWKNRDINSENAKQDAIEVKKLQSNLRKLSTILRDYSLSIYDEFDNQYNPITSDLNFPSNSSSLKEGSIISPEITKLFVNFIFDNLHVLNRKTEFENTEKLFQTYINQNRIRYPNVHRFFNSTTPPGRGDEDSVVTNFVVHHLFKQLVVCKNMLYNKDYGFPLNDSHSPNLIFFSVPYSAVETAIEGSEFSDVDISLLLTNFTYGYYKVRSVDVEKLIYKIKKEINEIGELAEEDFDGIFSTEKDIFKIPSISILKNLLEHDVKFFAEEKARELTEKDTLNKFKKYYLLTEILPDLKFTEQQENCSFMDIITSNVNMYKAAFTGTIFMDLPTYSDENREFIGCRSNLESDGATYAALLGVYNPKPEIFTLPVPNSPNRMYVLEKLLELIRENDYQVLIDAGAFLRDLTLDEVVNFFRIKLKKRYTIYIDSSNQIKIYNKEGVLIPYKGQTGSYYPDEIFMFYDNKHIIGTDIKQPYKLRGLVTVSNQNDLVEISQAAFRMRNLNYGHSADFIVESHVKSRVELLLDLHTKTYSNLFGSAKMKKTEQEIKSRFRLISDSYHIEKVFSKYLEIRHRKYWDSTNINPDSLEIDMRRNHIQNGWIVDHTKTASSEMDNTDLMNILELLFQDSIPAIINTNQEKEKSKERETETGKNISQNSTVISKRDTYSQILFSDGPRSVSFKTFFLTEQFPILQQTVAQLMRQTTDDDRKKVVEVQNSYNIYWSRLLSEFNYWNNDIWARKKLALQNNGLYPYKYISMLNAKSMYYIKYVNGTITNARKDNEVYLMITPRECNALLQFAKDYPETVNNLSDVWIKDKNGNILFGNETLETSHITPKELVVQQLLGRIASIEENFIITAYLRMNQDLYFLLDIFYKYYEVESYNKIMYDNHIMKITAEEFSQYIDKALQKKDDDVYYLSIYSLLFGSSIINKLLTPQPNKNNVVPQIIQKYFRRILEDIKPIYSNLDSIDEYLIEFLKKRKSVKISMYKTPMFDDEKVIAPVQTGGLLSKNELFMVEYYTKKLRKYKSKYMHLKTAMITQQKNHYASLF